MSLPTKISFTSIFVILFCVSVSPVNADTPCYVVAEGVLTDGSLCTGTVTIDGSVTSIGNLAFWNNSAISSVSIPSSVLHIGNNAFSGSGLTSITIPGTVTSIGEAAFQQIGSLSSVIIQEGITSLPSQAFYNNFSKSILNVSLPNTLTSIGDAAFFGSGLTFISIPNSVTSIGANAFENSLLSSVIIGENVTTIGAAAFYNNALTDLTIPNSVTTIGDYAFTSNLELTSITIGSGVTNIGGSAFENNIAVTALSFLGNEPSIGGFAFSGVPLTAVVSVPSTAVGYAPNDAGLWNGFSISRVVAPNISLTPASEGVTVNSSIAGFTIVSTGDTITSFSISPTAPAGLTFSTVTGLLTGAPTSVSPATVYTISARNVGGVSTATFTLTVRAVASASDNAAANAAAAAAAAERAAAAKREAREGILCRLRDGQGLTIESFMKAQISGITPENFADVQAELLNLPETSRSDINQILKVAYKYEVVGKISSDRVSYLLPNAFVEINLIPATSRNKVALVAVVKRLPVEARNTYAEIKAAIDQEIARIQERKDRIAAVIARNAKRGAA
jgi:hypothetical protein